MEFDTIKADIIETVSRDITTTITKSLEAKLDGFKEFIESKIKEIKTSYDSKILELTTKVNNLQNLIDTNIITTNIENHNTNQFDNKLNELSQKIDNIKVTQDNKLKSLVDDQEEQIDRNLRSTLIFRNINFDVRTETDPSKTIDVLATAVNKHCPNIGTDFFKNAVERGHRNLKPDRTITNRNAHSHPSISVKFLSWKDSNEILAAIIKQNKINKNANLLVSQQFSKSTTRRRNAALKLRKQLINENNQMEYRLIYPATLTGRIKDSNNKFETIEKF